MGGRCDLNGGDFTFVFYSLFILLVFYHSKRKMSSAEIRGSRFWRLNDQFLRFEGEECERCGVKIFPRRDLCPNCQGQSPVMPDNNAPEISEKIVQQITEIVGNKLE